MQRPGRRGRDFTYGNGITHTLTQNTRGLPSLSQDRYATTDYLKDAYTYDANGNVAAISDGLSGAAGNRTMTYDDLDRLASVAAPALYGGTIAYTYDSADKIRTVTKPGGVHLRYCYHPTNDVGLQFIRTGSTNCSDGAATTSFTFTTQGNLQSKNNVDYAFDIGNRLRNTQVAGAVTSQYAYDGHGRRVWDYTTDDKYSHYSLDGRLLMTADERGSGKVAEYIQLNGSLVALQERDVATGVYTTKYQHTDALGSPVVVTNQSRAVLERVAHEPYGKQVSGPVSDGPGYTGHVEDAATGLMYMQQRYYDPGVGAFLSVDPVTPDGAGGNFNRYWYANNNPYRFTDPDGRYSCDGDAAFCASISSYVASMKISKRSGMLKPSERGRIEAALEYIGEEGKGGPTYTSGVLSKGTLAKTDAKGNVTVDAEQIKSGEFGAVALGHEAQHDMDALKPGGVVFDEAGVTIAETNAYTTSRVIDKGFGNTWTDADFDKAVKTSVDNWKSKQTKEEEVK